MEIRTKSSNKLIDEATIPTIEKIVASQNASDEVFFALHSPEKLCSKYNLSYSGETAISFANELRYQYSQIFPEKPLCFEVSPGILFDSKNSPGFNQLLNAVPSAFVAYRILDSIIAYSFMEIKTLERAGFLLRCKEQDFPTPEEGERSKAERNWFGGLRELFSAKNGYADNSFCIACMLKPYHLEISKLFDEFMSLKYQSSYNKKEITPVIPPEKATQSATEIKPEEKTIEIPAENATTPTISPEKILSNQEAIRHFFAYANKLKTAGFYPAELLSKEESIQSFLKASAKLN